MKTAIFLLCILATGTVAQATERYTLRDTQGRLQGSLVITGPKITVRDASGRVTGSAVVSGNRVTIRDNQGRISGSAPSKGSSLFSSRGTAKKGK